MSIKSFIVGIIVGILLTFGLLNRRSSIVYDRVPSIVMKIDSLVDSIDILSYKIDSLRQLRSPLDSILYDTKIVVDTVHVRDTVVLSTQMDSLAFFRYAYPTLLRYSMLVTQENYLMQMKINKMEQQLSYWKRYYDLSSKQIKEYQLTIRRWQMIAVGVFVAGVLIGRL